MPVAAQIGEVLRDDHEVSFSGLDEAGATRTQVALAGRVWLDGTHHLVVHGSPACRRPHHHRHGCRHRDHDHRDVGRGRAMGAERVESHDGMVRATVPSEVRSPRAARDGAGLLAGSVPVMFHVADDGPVRRLTFDNAGRRNAIPAEQWSRLAELFGDFEESDRRVLVVTGAGGDFCSGADMGSSFTPGVVADAAAMMEQVGRAALALHRITKPTVAAVDGVAAGAGLNIALGCDLLVASERARFSEIFVRRGLTLDFGGTWLLPRRIGLARAKELALTGRVFDVAEAERLGLVTRIVPADRLADEVAALAVELAAGAPLAQRFVKAGLDRSFEMSFEQGIAYERAAQSVLLASEDFIEGAAAFLQKRDPDFTGR